MTLTERKTIEIGDHANDNGILIDVDPTDTHLNIRIGDKNVKVSKSEFWGVCFMMADEKTQESLMPVRQTEMMSFERIHRVRVTKDLIKGQTLKFKCKVDVPVAVVDSLKGVLDKEQKRSRFLL